MAAAATKGSSIKFTAVTDTYAAQIVGIVGLTFQGTGLTAGQVVTLLNDQDDIIAEYGIKAASDSADLWNGRELKFYHGLKMSGTVAGTWSLIVTKG